MNKFVRNGHHKNWKKRWKKIVKEDFDWDYGYLEKIIVHKLELMLEYYSDPENVAQVDETREPIVAEIQEVLDVFKKIEKSDYDQDAFDFHHDHCKAIEGEQIIHFGGKSTVCPTIRFEWDSEENRQTYLDMMKQAEEKEQADILKAYTLIAQNRGKWWD